jgi:hypothetical protein
MIAGHVAFSNREKAFAGLSILCERGMHDSMVLAL